MTHSRRTWLVKGAIVLVALTVVLTGVEAAARWFHLSKVWRSYHYPELPKYGEIVHRDNPVRGDYLRPNRQVVIRGRVMRTNRHGFRGPDYTPAKPPGMIRIACVGDSVTFGFDSPEEQTYARYLEQMLSVRGRRVEVLNFGVPGNNLVENLDVYFRKVPLFQPDVVILQFELGDFERIDSLRWSDAAATSSAGLLKNFLRKHSAGYLFVAERVNSILTYLGWETRLMRYFATLPGDFEHAQRVLEPFLADLRSRGTPAVFAFFPHEFHIISPRPELRQPSQVLRAFIESRGAVFVDLTEGLRAASSPFREVFYDEVHLTDRGNQVAARILHDAIEPLLLR